jgi:hypothetical protein
MAISKKRLTEIREISEIDMSDVDELGDSFFKSAILVKPGESLVSSVKSAFRTNPFGFS